MENQRIRITKSMLKNALIQLLQEKRIEKITIYELCATAQINRTTFYKYYGNQYDLMKDIEQDFFSELEQYLLMKDELQFDALERTMGYLKDNLPTCRVILNTIADQQFPQRLFSLPVIRSILDECICRNFPERYKDYVKLFFIQGGFSIIRTWLNGGCQESPKEIAELLYQVSGSLLG